MYERVFRFIILVPGSRTVRCKSYPYVCCFPPQDVRQLLGVGSDRRRASGAHGSTRRWPSEGFATESVQPHEHGVVSLYAAYKQIREEVFALGNGLTKEMRPEVETNDA